MVYRDTQYRGYTGVHNVGVIQGYTGIYRDIRGLKNIFFKRMSLAFITIKLQQKTFIEHENPSVQHIAHYIIHYFKL